MPLFGPNVEKLRAKRDIDGLARALVKSRDPAVRTLAAVALAELRDPRAVSPMIAALGHKDGHVRACAAVGLGSLVGMSNPVADAGPAVEALAVALHDDEERVRLAAADSLQHIGGPEAEQALTTHRRDD